MADNSPVIWSPAFPEQLSEWKSLPDNGYNADANQPSLEHILCRAILSNDYELVQKYISDGAKFIDSGWFHGAAFKQGHGAIQVPDPRRP